MTPEDLAKIPEPYLAQIPPNAVGFKWATEWWPEFFTESYMVGTVTQNVLPLTPIPAFLNGRHVEVTVFLPDGETL